MKTLSRLSIIITGLLLSLSLSCSRDTGKLRIGIIKPSIDHLPLSYAWEKGFLNKSESVVVQFSSGWEVQEAMNAGSIDLAIMPFSYAWTSVSKGYKLKIISCLERETDGILTTKNITSLSDLQDKKIGLLRASTLEILMQDAAEHAKLDYLPVYFRTPAEMTAALKAKQVAAIVSYVPLIQKATDEFHVLSWFAQRHPHHPCCDIVATERALNTQSGKIKAVQTAMAKAVKEINQPSAEIYDFLYKLYGLNALQAQSALEHTRFDLNLTDADMMFEQKMMQSFQDKAYVKTLPLPHNVFKKN